MKKDELKNLLFNPKGRINRMPYILTPIISSILFTIVIILLTILKIEILSQIFNYLGFIVLTAIAVILTIKRWHDLDKSGWLTVLIFIPILNFFIGLFLAFAKGTNGKNKYGSDPLA